MVPSSQPLKAGHELLARPVLDDGTWQEMALEAFGLGVRLIVCIYIWFCIYVHSYNMCCIRISNRIEVV